MCLSWYPVTHGSRAAGDIQYAGDLQRAGARPAQRQVHDRQGRSQGPTTPDQGLLW